VTRLAAVAVAALALTACSSSPTRRTLGPSRRAVAPPPQLEPAPAPVQPQPDVLVARARVLRAEGDVAAARARLEAALEVSPQHEEARVELADLLVADARELERAGALLGGVTQQRDARYHLVQARLAEATRDDAGAAAAYEAALAIADDPDARLRRGLALARLGRPEAVDELERVRAARPDDTMARSHLAELYEAAGRLADAEAEYRWLAESQPERAAAWERLARFYERTGRPKDARAAIAQAHKASARPDRSLRPLLPSKR
jgi:hypothetical protein